MHDLSISQALGAGFRLIARKPLAALAWGVAYFVVGMLPIMLVLLFGAQAFVEMIRQAAANPYADTNPFMAGMVGPLALLQPVGFLSAIAAKAIVMNAIFRAVLEPEDDHAFYLRFGGAELWQGLVQLCLQILISIAAVIAFIAVALVAAVVVFALMASGVRDFHPWMAVAGGLVVLLILGVLAWLWLRLSMAGPMTFRDRTFRLFESWTLTRGHGGSLFLLALGIVAIILAIELVVFGLAGVVVVAVIGGMAGFADEATLAAFFEQPSSVWLPAVMTVALVVSAIACLVSGFLLAIVIAPWADAYRQLAPRLDDPAAPLVEGT
jgi:hypothetical protein